MPESKSPTTGPVERTLNGVGTLIQTLLYVAAAFVGVRLIIWSWPSLKDIIWPW